LGHGVSERNVFRRGFLFPGHGFLGGEVNFFGNNGVKNSTITDLKSAKKAVPLNF
jgi:hypothetical protein